MENVNTIILNFEEELKAISKDIKDYELILTINASTSSILKELFTLISKYLKETNAKNKQLLSQQISAKLNSLSKEITIRLLNKDKEIIASVLRKSMYLKKLIEFINELKKGNFDYKALSLRIIELLKYAEQEKKRIIETRDLLKMLEKSLNQKLD